MGLKPQKVISVTGKVKNGKYPGGETRQHKLWKNGDAIFYVKLSVEGLGWPIQANYALFRSKQQATLINFTGIMRFFSEVNWTQTRTKNVNFPL